MSDLLEGNWTRDQPAYYMDFEILNCVELMNGAQHTDDGKMKSFFKFLTQNTWCYYDIIKIYVPSDIF